MSFIKLLYNNIFTCIRVLWNVIWDPKGIFKRNDQSD